MKIVLFSFYFPPDLSAGSFRSNSLVKALDDKIKNSDQIHIITSQPNRYLSHRVRASSREEKNKITIHRINVPSHNSGMILQTYAYSIFAINAFIKCMQIKPDFLIGTTSRLMTGFLTYISASFLKRKYFIDLRDILSETLSDIFTYKSSFLGKIVKNSLSMIDKIVLKNAAGVNVVSEGFPAYFDNQGIDTSNWSFFPNGIDDEFLNYTACTNSDDKDTKIIILYAGNIGRGQGLEFIIPDLAEGLGSKYLFKIIGDGGSFSNLKERILNRKINNVQLLAPMSRVELINHYSTADILFLNLNNINAFQRVLPSKLFEYIALKKPIIAGLSGYSATFLKKYASYASVFSPGDSESAMNAIKNSSRNDVSELEVENFINNFSRASIMDEMAKHLINIFESNG